MPDFVPGYCWTRDGLPTFAYNESAFRHFLAVERARARRSGRALYLVLAGLRADQGRGANLGETTGAALLSGLAASVRGVDFVGWYKEGRVAAAVLAQGEKAGNDVSQVIAGRITPIVTSQMPREHSSKVRIRVVRLGRQIAS